MGTCPPAASAASATRPARPPRPAGLWLASTMIQSPLLGYTAFSHLLQRPGHDLAPAGTNTSSMTSPSTGSGRGTACGLQGLQGVHAGAAGGRPGLPLPLAGGVPPGMPSGVPQFLASSLLQHLQHPQLPPQLAAGLSARCPSPSPGSMGSVSPSPSSSPPTSLGGLSGLSGLSGLGLPAGHGVKSFTIDAILGLSAAHAAHAAHHPQHAAHREAGHYHRGAIGANPYPLAEPPSSPTDLSCGRPPAPHGQQHRPASGEFSRQLPPVSEED